MTSPVVPTVAAWHQDRRWVYSITFDKARYYLMPAAMPFLRTRAAERKWPCDGVTTSRLHRFDGATVPCAARFVETFIRWFTFCEKYRDADADLAVEIVREVAERNRIKS